MWGKHSETVHGEYLVLVFFRYMLFAYGAVLYNEQSPVNLLVARMSSIDE